MVCFGLFLLKSLKNRPSGGALGVKCATRSDTPSIDAFQPRRPDTANAGARQARKTELNHRTTRSDAVVYCSARSIYCGNCKTTLRHSIHIR